MPGRKSCPEEAKMKRIFMVVAAGVTILLAGTYYRSNPAMTAGVLLVGGGVVLALAVSLVRWLRKSPPNDVYRIVTLIPRDRE